MRLSGAQIIVQSLKSEGVKYVFGYPGGAVLEIYDAIFQLNAFRHILVRHEQAAGHMADAYSRVSGKTGEGVEALIRATGADAALFVFDSRLGLTPLDEEIADGSITLDRSGDEPVIRYYEHVFPVADGSLDGIGEAPQGDELARLLERQHYRLAFWRDRDAVLNYRRFFEVNELIAVRVETDDPALVTRQMLEDMLRYKRLEGVDAALRQLLAG